MLGLMVEQGFISAAEADAAWAEPLAYEPVQFDLKSPHFTFYVRQQLEQMFGSEGLYRSGYNVYTTLDPHLQAEAERIVREQVDALAYRNVSNGALVSMRPQTGEVVALVGSADFNNVEIDGQVDMALARANPVFRPSPLSISRPLRCLAGHATKRGRRAAQWRTSKPRFQTAPSSVRADQL